MGLHQKSVAFAVRYQIDSCVLSFEAINERICTLRLKGRFKNISLICIYAPTNMSDEEEKDKFYELLESTWSNLPNYDVKIILGDANAQICKENIWQSVAGKESLHNDSNDNGIRLLNMAVGANLKIVSTMFPRKNIHKETWYSPDGKTINQIDHVLIDTRHRKHVTNVRSIRGAECGTDHNLVLVTIYQRLAVEKKNKAKQNQMINWEKLKDPIVASNFRTNLICKFNEATPNDINVDIEVKWNRVKNTVLQCAKDLCGDKQKQPTKPWFDQECNEMIEKRRFSREKWLGANNEEERLRYQNINRSTTRLLRQKKRNWLKSLVEKAEQDRTNNNARDFYRTTRFFQKEYKPKAYGVKDKDGNILIQQSEGLVRWKEYFEELLNGDVEQDIELRPRYLNVQPEVEKPSLEEVTKAIQEMKNNKAPGEDGINSEIIKAGNDILAKEIYKLIL